MQVIVVQVFPVSISFRGHGVDTAAAAAEEEREEEDKDFIVEDGLEESIGAPPLSPPHISKRASLEGIPPHPADESRQIGAWLPT